MRKKKFLELSDCMSISWLTIRSSQFVRLSCIIENVNYCFNFYEETVLRMYVKCIFIARLVKILMNFCFMSLRNGTWTFYWTLSLIMWYWNHVIHKGRLPCDEKYWKGQVKLKRNNNQETISNPVTNETQTMIILFCLTPKSKTEK